MLKCHTQLGNARVGSATVNTSIAEPVTKSSQNLKKCKLLTSTISAHQCIADDDTVVQVLYYSTL